MLLDAIAKMTRQHRVALCIFMFIAVAFWHLLIAVYLLPTMVAICRAHHKAVLIILGNLLLGWTPLWFLIIAYAAFGDHGTPIAARQYRGPRVPITVTVKANVNSSKKDNTIII